MRNFSPLHFLLLPVAALLALQSATAAEVYRWTDADGVVHFSQTPPPPGAEANKLILNDPKPADAQATEDIYDVAGQQARMQALREEREQKRQERLERQRREASQRPAPVYQQQEQINPGWWLLPRPPVRPLPPIERPPPGPGDPIRPPGMIKPPRPITPGG